MIGYQVKKIRKKRGLGQKECADLLGIGQSSYSGRENGNPEFNKDELAILAKALHVPVTAFNEDEWDDESVVSEAPADKYERKDDGLDLKIPTEQFILLTRRYMADNQIDTLKDMAMKMKTPYIYFKNVMNGHKPITLKVLMQSVKNCKYNANFILARYGDEYIKAGEIKGMIAELHENYKRSIERMEKQLADKEKLIKSYALLLKEKGVDI